MPITPQEALLRCIEHREIFHDEMLYLFRQIMSGEMSPTMIAALTMGLRVKKETIGEIAAAAQVMREFSTKVPMADTTNLLDIVGTGAACFMAAWWFGAYMKPMPVCAIDWAICSGCRLMLTPKESSTSALPDEDDTLRPPCLAATIWMKCRWARPPWWAN